MKMKESFMKRASEGDVYHIQKRSQVESDAIQLSKRAKTLEAELMDVKKVIKRLQLENTLLRDCIFKSSNDHIIHARMKKVSQEIEKNTPAILNTLSHSPVKTPPTSVEQIQPLSPSSGHPILHFSRSNSPLSDLDSFDPPSSHFDLRPPSPIPLSTLPTKPSNSPETSSKSKRPKRAVILPDMIVLSDYMPVLPIQVGVFTLHCLGTVCSDEGYHSERYIYPIGYRITRSFQSAIHKDSFTTYTCSVERGDPGKGPVFQVVAEDNPTVYVQGNSPTQCWTSIARAVNIIKERTHGGSVNGPDYFGFTQGLIIYWLQKLPGVAALSKYTMQDIQLFDHRQQKKGLEKKKNIK